MFWKKKEKTFGQQFIESAKKSIVESMIEQMIAFQPIQLDIDGCTKKLMATILGGKKVPIVTPSKKEEEDETDTIYFDIMSKINGDRDVVYHTPDPIEINAFTNDALSPSERDEVYEIIDTINEANDINRDGTYRTGEDEHPESNDNNTDTNITVGNMIAKSLSQMINPMLSMLSMFFTCSMSLIMLSKFAAILDRIAI